MAPKGSAPALDNPPSASSDDETEDNLAVNEEEEEDLSAGEAKPEESESEDSEEDDDEIDDEDKPSSENPKQISATQEPQSDSDEGSETESDLDDTQKSSPSASGFTVKPIVQTAKFAAKRAAETKEDPKRKKSKVVSDGSEAEAKKSGLGLVWNEDDEVAVLQGISDYRKQTGSDPFDDMGAFLDFVKGSLSFEVSKSQLSEKAKRLKKKYFDHAVRAENGADRIFTRPRDYNLFHVSKKVWGDEYKNGVNASVSKSQKSLVKEKEETKDTVSTKNENNEDNKEIVKGDFESTYPNICAALKNESFPLLTVPVGCRGLIKEILSSDEDKARLLEAAWKDHHVYEMELRTKGLELVKEVGYGALDALKR